MIELLFLPIQPVLLFPGLVVLPACLFGYGAWRTRARGRVRAGIEQLKAKVDVGYEDLGERRVKNIETPIRVYRVLLDPGAAGRSVIATSTRLRRWSRPAAGATGVMAVLLAAGYFGIFPIRPPANPLAPGPGKS